MAVPVHLFLKDDGGAMIRGGSDVQDVKAVLSYVV